MVTLPIRFKIPRFFLVLFLVIQVNGIYRETLNNWQEEDSVIIDAIPSVDDELGNVHESESERHKRQIFTGFFVRTMSDNLKEGETCQTPDGEEGHCHRLKHCYPFMYQYDVNDDSVYEGNLELARMLTQSTGSCGGQEAFHLYGSSPVGTVPSETQMGDLVCCVGNVTMLNVPKFPMPLTVGGAPASQNAYPAMVALLSGRLFCGGSLIDSRNVLTAAHCVSHMDGNAVARVTAQIGDHDIYSTRDGPHETRKIRRIIKHRQFNRQTLHNDIAILTLSSPVTFNSRINAIGLGGGGGTSATVVGWGKLAEHAQYPSVLHHVNIGLLTNQKCAQVYGSLAPGGIIPSMLCGGSSSRDACSGDSGGPLIVSGSQIGIVSWGIGCGSYPGVYTRVSSFLSWIHKNQRIP